MTGPVIEPATPHTPNAVFASGRSVSAVGQPSAANAESFPRQQALTHRFRLGAPSHFVVAPNDQRVLFLRSGTSRDPVNKLWALERSDTGGTELLVVDPRELFESGFDDLPLAERARRERARETTAGITAFATDTAVERVAFALRGRLGVAALAGASSSSAWLETSGQVVDPRPDPTGQRLAWVQNQAVWVGDFDGANQRELVAPTGRDQAWGSAEFIAAEELDRHRGFWWSPDGQKLLICEVDESAVGRWWIGDPSQPAREPVATRYPAAGKANAVVRLWLVALDGSRRLVDWSTLFPEAEYLSSVRWNAAGDALITLLNRRQTVAVTVAIDAAGNCREADRSTSDRWVQLFPGAPGWAPSGGLVTVRPDLVTDTWRLAVDGQFLTPAGLQVRAVLDIRDDGVLITASGDPTECRVVHVDWEGGTVDIADQGWNRAVRGGSSIVLISTNWDSSEAACRWTEGNPVAGLAGLAGLAEISRIASLAEAPAISPQVELLVCGERQLRAVVQWPVGHEPGDAPLPVLLNPYGGPHSQRVVASGRAFAETQWWADQGFCVIVADGRGSPGRGPKFEHSIYRDLAGPPLEDQIAVLDYVARRFPGQLDLGRVAIMGWSFGGFLAALAVLRRPDVFRGAIAGAPVTDWRLYDTCYTERYLGLPGDVDVVRRPDVVGHVSDPYESSGLPGLAPTIKRPLLIIHGLADDNVVSAHSLRLSAQLTASGHPHTFLPLINVTHQASQADIAENLLGLQLKFLQQIFLEVASP